jgi:hypothetical protein
MSVINNNLLLTAAAGGGGAYNIERSLRFNRPDSATLSKTPGSAGNQKTWTWSAWIKRTGLSLNQSFFAAYSSGSVNGYIRFTASDFIDIYSRDGAGTQMAFTTAAMFRDISGWMHLVFSVDTTQATASNRAKLYINNTQVTAFSSETYPDQNANLAFNGTFLHSIGDLAQSTQYFNGYLADVHFVNNQQLDPSSFTTTDVNGELVPKAYVGSYGTNGYRLSFSDNSTTAALGTDSSGNGNTWTVNNFSVTAGSDNDSLVDTPNSYGTDTGVGGEVRGNYCTLNPLDRNKFADIETLSQGNLEVAFGTSGDFGTRSTFYVTSGKWYWEATLKTAGSGLITCGISQQSSQYYTGYSAGSYAYVKGGNKIEDATQVTYGASYAVNDIIGIAFNLDAGTITFYKNGTSQGQAFSSVSGVFTPSVGCSSSSGTAWILNFGQRPFAYSSPAGFQALCGTNLPAGSITTSGSFSGNANSDGPFIWLNGVPTAMTINSNAVTFGTHADNLANGFKVRTSSSSYNSAGSNTYSITTTGAKFKYARAQSNP